MNRPAYRIIDANANRAREALRLMEEFCRFALNSSHLTTRTNRLRHHLIEKLSAFERAKLISARDTENDVGTVQATQNKLQRKNLQESFDAAAARASEALRAIAETSKTFKPRIAKEIEKIRYELYTLEKQITIFAEPQKKFAPVSLYVIISNTMPAEILSLAAQCASAGADCIQLRAKKIPDDRLFALASEFVNICKAENVLSIINDRPDIAVASGADGLHLGQNDIPLKQAQKLQHSPLIIGTSTHSKKQLLAAVKNQPTYVSLGPVFKTPTKPDAKPVGLKYVSESIQTLRETGIHHVAIGAITPQNVEQVIKAGASAVAVSSAITQAPDPAEACKKLKNKIRHAKNKTQQPPKKP